jgi:hypothetical protein
MTISFDSKLRVPGDVMVSNLGGESVLLNLKTERYHGLDEIGFRFWELVTSSDSIQRAYDALVQEYDAAPETLRNDLAELIAALHQQGLVEFVDS